MGNTLITYTPEDVRDESVLTGKPNLVRVMVEDESDKSFWLDILSETLPTKEYDICPYSRNESGEIVSHSKGVQHILKEAKNGNLAENNIACIDSDYNYIFSSYAIDSDCINSNKFIIQTYAYSIENLLIQPETLCDLIENVTGDRPEDIFCDFIREVSSILYPLLVGAFLVKKHSGVEFCESDWRKVLPKDNTILQYSRKQLLDRIKQLVNANVTKLHNLYPEPEWHKAKSELEQTCGLTPKFAYKYVRGHDLFEFIHTVIVKPTADSMERSHFLAIKKDIKLSDEERNRELQRYSETVKKPIREHMYENFKYKDYASEAEMIRQAIRQIDE